VKTGMKMKMMVMVMVMVIMTVIMKLLKSWEERKLKVKRKVAWQVKMVTVMALRKSHLVLHALLMSLLKSLEVKRKSQRKREFCQPEELRRALEDRRMEKLTSPIRMTSKSLNIWTLLMQTWMRSLRKLCVHSWPSW